MEWDLFGKLSYRVSACLWERLVFQVNDVIHSRATFSLSGITNESPSQFSMEKRNNIPCIDTCLRIWMLQNCVFPSKGWDTLRQAKLQDCPLSHAWFCKQVFPVSKQTVSVIQVVVTLIIFCSCHHPYLFAHIFKPS